MASLAILAGFALPARQWISHGMPSTYWSPFLPFVSPAIALLLLIWLSGRVRAAVLQRWSLAGLAVLAVVAAVIPPARLTTTIYVLCALLLNGAVRIEGFQPRRTEDSCGDGPA